MHASAETMAWVASMSNSIPPCVPALVQVALARIERKVRVRLAGVERSYRRAARSCTVELRLARLATTVDDVDLDFVHIVVDIPHRQPCNDARYGDNGVRDNFVLRRFRA